MTESRQWLSAQPLSLCWIQWVFTVHHHHALRLAPNLDVDEAVPLPSSSPLDAVHLVFLSPTFLTPDSPRRSLSACSFERITARRPLLSLRRPSSSCSTPSMPTRALWGTVLLLPHPAPLPTRQ